MSYYIYCATRELWKILKNVSQRLLDGQNYVTVPVSISTHLRAYGKNSIRTAHFLSLCSSSLHAGMARLANVLFQRPRSH